MSAHALNWPQINQAVTLLPPASVLVWQAWVRVGPRQSLGNSPAGERFMIPILGGEFQGGQSDKALHGQVLAGGADRQLLRPDGIKELDALYEMQTHDGAVLTIHNQVLIDESAQPQRYVFSQVRITAPVGPYDWLNRRVFVGTLHPLPPEAQAVLIRVWQLI
jgi:hypothetical protein